MPKKKPSKIPLPVKYILVTACIVVIGFVAINRSLMAIKHMGYFKIKSVIIDPSLPFINKQDFRHVIGKNIFAIDVQRVQRLLARKYPQASDLRVNRRFPNQISIVAKQRMPFAQIKIGEKVVILDKEGVVLSLNSKRSKDLPNVSGTKLNNSLLTLGLPLRESSLTTALKIIRLFAANDSLKSYAIEDINIENQSKIHCLLTNKIDVIVDRERVAKKINDLGAVLAQDYLTLNDIEYVDLRFKDPLIGKK